MKPIIWISSLVLILSACGTERKLREIRTGSADARLSLRQEERPILLHTDDLPQPQDTIIVKDLQGNDVFLMRAVQDQNGEMIASEVLQPAVISASFHNVAERLGKVELSFCIHVPNRLQDPSWQLRFFPVLYLDNDSISLSPVFVTGQEYRENQRKGYQSYHRFLNSIIRDSAELRNQRLIALFQSRKYEDYFNIQQQAVLSHYNLHGRIRRNNRRQLRLQDVFRRKIKDPYPTEPIYLDTATNSMLPELAIDYSYTLLTRPNLRKADLILKGEIWRNGIQLYQMPTSDPLTFYISSITTLLEEKCRYVQRIVERRAQSNSMIYLDFQKGSPKIDTTLHKNARELKRIEAKILELMANSTYDIDSLVITATCSPEGRYSHNQALAQARGNALKAHFEHFVAHQQHIHELDQENTLFVNLDSTATAPRPWLNHFELIIRPIPEDWKRLGDLVRKDTLLKDPQYLLSIIESTHPADVKERLLQKSSEYPYVSQVLFPRMRTVRFDFHLHRKGMVKDTLHTTEIDTIYQNGLKALRNRKFEIALTHLRPYEDYNTAIACLCLDYNHTARAILEQLPANSKRNYMLAVACSRLHDTENALSYLLQSIEEEPSLQFRGNLDPEISQLMRTYNLFNQY
ncbi:MAG: hypothetical protein IKV28_02915 [Bacteroidales bacterium]|nr:hypothetical protein [Bacteroidales bacterium]